MTTDPATTSTIAVTLLLAALGLKLTDFVKSVTNWANGKDDDTKKRARNDLITFLVAWIIGIGAALVLSKTAWGDEITVGKEALASLSLGSLVVFGLVFSTVAGTLYDFKKAIDNKDSAKKDPLIPSTPRDGDAQ